MPSATEPTTTRPATGTDPATQSSLGEGAKADTQPALGKVEVPAAVTVQANALVDKYWADLNRQMALTGMTDAEIVAVVQALRQGIQDGLNATNPDDNQPPGKAKIKLS